jgi:hypothetical protein
VGSDAARPALQSSGRCRGTGIWSSNHQFSHPRRRRGRLMLRACCATFDCFEVARVHRVPCKYLAWLGISWAATFTHWGVKCLLQPALILSHIGV